MSLFDLLKIAYSCSIVTMIKTDELPEQFG